MFDQILAGAILLLILTLLVWHLVKGYKNSDYDSVIAKCGEAFNNTFDEACVQGLMFLGFGVGYIAIVVMVKVMLGIEIFD